MHRNYYLFLRQIHYLNSFFKGATVIKCFSHRKDELVLKLLCTKEYFLRISVQKQFPYLLVYSAQNIKEPQIQFFKEIIGKRIKEFSIAKFDKIIYIKLEEYSLELKLFGSKNNIYLINVSNEYINYFKKNNLKKRGENKTDILDPANINLDHIKIFSQTVQKCSISDFIAKYIGGFNKIIAIETCYRSRIDMNKYTDEVSDHEWKCMVQIVRKLRNELENLPQKLYKRESFHKGENTKPVIISIIELLHLPTAYTSVTYDDINQAWRDFIFYYQRQFKIDQIKEKVRQALRKHIDYITNTLNSISEASKRKIKKTECELKGNLLLVNIHNIPSGVSEVKLTNIFSAQQEPVTIKLNPGRSIQENAQLYFQKYKSEDNNKLELKIKKDTFNHELRYWQKIEYDIEKINSLKQADKLCNLLIDKNIIQVPVNKKKKMEGSIRRNTLIKYSFHRLILAEKWHVYIGRNDRNNDLLTFNFANKHDLWFHAQGVSGSHVILHLDKDQIPPMNIIEQTACLAAYYSKAKNSSIVPVNYTRVKYVRKPRKSRAGTVVISNEKTIFAEPKKLG
jgi:predicted ribosome quality control (RQC) complex YloA/Tae2 family protein